MSTRALIGTVDTDGNYQGRYTNFDGYPTSLGADLGRIVARDGLPTALTVLTTTHASWSSVDADTPDLTGVYPDYDAPADSPQRFAWTVAQSSADTVVIPGYGVAYTGTDNPAMSDPTAGWEIGTVDLDTGAVVGVRESGLDWGYVFTGTGPGADLLILGGGEGQVAARLPVSGLPYDHTTWQGVECGEHFERCDHYAKVHEDHLPEGTDHQYLGMRQWLGLTPMTLDDAVALTTPNGRRLTLTRFGCLRGDTWWAKVCGSRGITETPLYTVRQGPPCRIGRDHRDMVPIPGVKYHYPATKPEVEAQRVSA